MEEGQLLTRYYFVDGGTYTYEKDGKAAARAVAAVYGKGFYMGNYLKITYSWPDGAQEEGVTDHILATVALYSDADYQDPIAEDSEDHTAGDRKNEPRHVTEVRCGSR